jgi:hypothetical protein
MPRSNFLAVLRVILELFAVKHNMDQRITPGSPRNNAG